MSGNPESLRLGVLLFERWPKWLTASRARWGARWAYFSIIFTNGGQRNKKTASDLKRQGVKSGVFNLPVRQARGGWFGLYLEFKATPPRDAALAPSQFDWLEGSEYEGYCAVLARGLDKAKSVLREYASWPRTQIVGERLALESGSEWRKG
ncbi:VRR-NUC domain-containing protein [Halomonas sp. MS1]|nr:VRR-NUC domain-containing protein [Halomonas sp. MS1]UTD54796.1 VRR-NUC domain-containing protein [Halomonas sp. MS1]